MSQNKLLVGVAESASYNILLQVFFRIQTFLLNGFILRFIDKDVLGIINVRLTLLYSTLTFLSTEAFKNATIANPERQKWREAINLLWLTVPTAAVCSVFLGYLWLFALEQPEAALKDQYRAAVVAVCISCIIERLAEPFHVVAQIFLFNKLRALSQCITVASQCLIFTVFVCSKPEYSIFGFCIAQLTRSILWVIIFYGYFMFYVQNSTLDYFKNFRDFFPRVHSKCRFLAPDHISLAVSFFKQGILKQLLTEGERYLMTIFNILNFADQGIYDVVSNLGSLAARFIFRPVEESGYQFFAQCIQRDVPLAKQDRNAVSIAAKVLEYMLKVMVFLSIIILCFGYSYSRIFLHLYGGTLLSSGMGPVLLRWHCFYILFIAVNGVTEAYAFATMSKSSIDRFNYFMLFISLIFLIAAWYLTPIYGGAGLILANCCNMVLRISHSLYFIMRSFSNTPHCPIRGLVPHKWIFASTMVSWIVTASTENIFYSHEFSLIISHVAIGCICLLFVAISAFFAEKELLHFVIHMWRKRTIDDEELKID